MAGEEGNATGTVDPVTLGVRCCFLLSPWPSPADPTHTPAGCPPLLSHGHLGQARTAWTASLPGTRPRTVGLAHSGTFPTLSCCVPDPFCKGSARLGGPLQPLCGDEPRRPSVRAHKRGHVEGPGGGLVCVTAAPQGLGLWLPARWAPSPSCASSWGPALQQHPSARLPGLEPPRGQRGVCAGTWWRPLLPGVGGAAGVTCGKGLCGRE